MTVEQLNGLEDRIRKPGYLLFLVVVLLFLIIGFVNLLDRSSGGTAVFGRYSISYAIFLLVYLAGMIGWASLLLRPNDDRWLVAVLDYIQKRPFLAVAILLGIAAVLIAMVVPKQPIHNRLLALPALQVSIVVILLIAAGLIVFYRWGDESLPQLWRKIVVAVVGFILIVELVLQALSFFGIVPSTTTTRQGFEPYSRVYYSDEGLGNGITNNYGRYAPPFELLPDSRRIALVGDTMLQGLQVSVDDNLGVGLQELIDENMAAEQPVEILTLGYPDYGPGMYLNNWMLGVNTREFEPAEVIAFFDLGGDFQTAEGPGEGVPFYEYVGQGRVQLNLDAFFTDVHNAEHEVMEGHEGFQLVRLIGSHYLTPQIIGRLIEQPTVQAAEKADGRNPDIDLPNGFVFNEETNDQAHLIASSLLNMANDQLALNDIDFKLVTIPVFTEAFYAQDQWNTQFGDSDLLLPEQKLRVTAEKYNLPFLGLGAYMQSLGMTPQEVQALYYEDGLGHFTPAGHQLAAEAVYQCFFAQSLTPAAGCDLR